MVLFEEVDNRIISLGLPNPNRVAYLAKEIFGDSNELHQEGRRQVVPLDLSLVYLGACDFLEPGESYRLHASKWFTPDQRVNVSKDGVFQAYPRNGEPEGVSLESWDFENGYFDFKGLNDDDLSQVDYGDNDVNCGHWLREFLEQEKAIHSYFSISFLERLASTTGKILQTGTKDLADYVLSDRNVELTNKTSFFYSGFSLKIRDIESLRRDDYTRFGIKAFEPYSDLENEGLVPKSSCASFPFQIVDEMGNVVASIVKDVKVRHLSRKA